MNKDSLNDIQTWNRISAGDREAFAVIYKAYSKDLFKYGFGFTHDEDLIQDAIHDVFVHIWNVREKISIHRSIKFYLFSSFRREIIKMVNHQYKRESIDEYHAKFLWEESFEELLQKHHIVSESAVMINEALENLPLRQKEAIYLRVLEELDYEEISELMGVQVPSIYNLIFKGIKTLKNSLDFRKIAISIFCFALLNF
ncbi:sigma-70 family RNA polymerase sigma factor [Echinicola sp. CAU 1574]|uniref:Sigma-70 family RNA polymerase sigma factor n=1 Tax=Echinicola arenosa TaxID=2774144 RepID=A0ABR9AK59_9BACT|nr:sigma-70 family RNA polymerase sigma factor [Echinicola arenosa]MBD8488732.1 sigma-70 family RNA polymerase sigma factor [Echinicola arenosa]